MRFAVIGCGVIGNRRSESLPSGCQVTACFDPNHERAKSFADKFGAKSFNSLAELLNAKLADVAIISTINSALAPSLRECLNAGVHALVEKPAARTADELRAINVPKGLKVKIGFNHRFHPAYFDIKNELAARPQDPILFARARYGNGARVGFDREWRANPELSGGGELLDQGVHVLDLANGIIPGLKVISGLSRTLYWDMPVDDNTWGMLTTQKNQVFSFQVSSTEWKNEFCFEVYTRERKYSWNGLGRSYGPETLTIYKMKPEMGPPEVETRQYPKEDNSWLLENQNFVAAAAEGVQLDGGIEDAIRCMDQVKDVYRLSREISASQKHPVWTE